MFSRPLGHALLSTNSRRLLSIISQRSVLLMLSRIVKMRFWVDRAAEAYAKGTRGQTNRHVPQAGMASIACSFPQSQYYFPHHLGGRPALVMVRTLPRSSSSLSWIGRPPLTEDAVLSKLVFELAPTPFNPGKCRYSSHSDSTTLAPGSPSPASEKPSSLSLE